MGNHRLYLLMALALMSAMLARPFAHMAQQGRGVAVEVSLAGPFANPLLLVAAPDPGEPADKPASPLPLTTLAAFAYAAFLLMRSRSGARMPCLARARYLDRHVMPATGPPAAL